MAQIVTINMGEMAVAHNDTIIKTGSIGSCVVIVLYDDAARVGGMAHAMLPQMPLDKIGNGRDILQAKYADQAVDNLVRGIESAGGKKERLKAKLVGGARMFKILEGDRYGIGYQNAEAAKKRLTELGIPIVSEDVGGNVGKMAELNLKTGLVDVATKM
jgi:chemotaxis protein CheD